MQQDLGKALTRLAWPAVLGLLFIAAIGSAMMAPRYDAYETYEPAPAYYDDYADYDGYPQPYDGYDDPAVLQGGFDSYGEPVDPGAQPPTDEELRELMEAPEEAQAAEP